MAAEQAMSDHFLPIHRDLCDVDVMTQRKFSSEHSLDSADAIVMAARQERFDCLSKEDLERPGAPRDVHAVNRAFCKRQQGLSAEAYVPCPLSQSDETLTESSANATDTISMCISKEDLKNWLNTYGTNPFTGEHLCARGGCTESSVLERAVRRMDGGLALLIQRVGNNYETDQEGREGLEKFVAKFEKILRQDLNADLLSNETKALLAKRGIPEPRGSILDLLANSASLLQGYDSITSAQDSLLKEAAKIATLQFCKGNQEFKTYFQLESVASVRGILQYWWDDLEFVRVASKSKCYKFLASFVNRCRNYAEHLLEKCDSLRNTWAESFLHAPVLRNLRPLQHGNDKSSLRRELLKVETCLALSPEDKRLEKRKGQLESALRPWREALSRLSLLERSSR